MNSTIRSFAFTAVLLVLLVQAHAASPRYSLSLLRSISTAAGMYANANDINDAGVVVGSESRIVQGTPSTGLGVDWANTRPLQWSMGTTDATLLPMLSGYGSEAYAINNAGLVVGASASATGSFPPTRATIFRSGAAALIPGHTAGNYSLAVDVNDAGLAVGTDSALPFAYDTSTNTEVTLNRNNTVWRAEAVNESGTIVANGGSSNNADVRPARLSNSSAPAFLYSGSNRGSVVDVNDAGVAVGQYDTGSFNYRPAIFRNGIVQTLTINGIAAGGALAINDQGRVVGWTRTTTGVIDTFVYENGVLTSLASLVNGLPTRTRITPFAINNRGQIVGQTAYDHDNNATTAMIIGAFRLDPIRSPGDTNYDDAVDFADLLTLAQHYGQSGNGNVFWETGDFNYDWVVDFDDLLTLAQNYDTSQSLESDWALARSLVPEPVVLLAGLILLVPASRRWR